MRPPRFTVPAPAESNAGALFPACQCSLSTAFYFLERGDFERRSFHFSASMLQRHSRNRLAASRDRRIYSAFPHCRHADGPLGRLIVVTHDTIRFTGSALSQRQRVSPSHPIKPAYFLDFPVAGFRRRTPGPPPFSSMNSTPAASIAVRNLWVVSSRPPSSPSTASSRATVGSEIPELSAKSA
jgi:hypothetical protein